MASPDLSDYVPVSERIAKLRADHPDAVLQTIGYKLEVVDGKTFLALCAACFYGPDDPLPGIAFAWEPVPGRTPYTRDSELMNAETSAWGRAIVAKLAAETSRGGLASREEVEARTGDPIPDPPVSVSALLVKLNRAIEERGLPDGVPWPIPFDPAPSVEQLTTWLNAALARPRETPPPERVRPTMPPAHAGTDTAPVGPPDATDGPPWERRTFPALGPPDAIARWWKVAIAALPGVGPTKLLTAARDIAVAQGIAVPAALDEIHDAELVAAVRVWLNHRAADMGQDA